METLNYDSLYVITEDMIKNIERIKYLVSYFLLHYYYIKNFSFCQ